VAPLTARAAVAPATRHRDASIVERALGVFTEVRRGEAAAALWMLASVFLILAAYYFVKPARDGLLAVSPAGGLSETELKAYSSFGQSLCLLAALPLYDRISRALARSRLVAVMTLFFAANLVVFWALQPGLLFARPRFVGVVFYLWVGIFNVFIVAQFWAFAADLYGDEAGKRLFPLIAVGATSGAAAGSWMAKRLVGAVGTYGLLLAAAALLVCSLATMRAAESSAGSPDDGTRASPEARDLSGGLRLIFRHRYLLGAALLVLLVNWVNTNGENLLFGSVERALHARAEARGLAGGAAAEAFIRDETTRFYGDLFFWVNVAALGMQSLLASRILRYGGFAALLLVMPAVSLVSYALMALHPRLAVIRFMKIAENSTDYSLNNTAKQVLWLPTTRDMKYRAKAAVDTLFVRAGDGLAALTAFLGISVLGLPLPGLFAVNVALVAVWLVVATWVAREHRRLARRPRVAAA
jgi:ATP:ADP antiporter, AAA family